MQVSESCFKMKPAIYISLILIFLTLFVSGQEIEYSHKSIIKEIEKSEKIQNPVLNEIEIPKDLVKGKSVQGKFFTITGTQDKIFFLFTGRVFTCRTGGCTLKEPDKNSGGEFFDYCILINPDFSVKLVKIFNYQATHGHEITAKNWLRQFSGYDGSEDLVVGKDIDAISGATISVHSITYDIYDKIKLLKQIKHLQ
jgi:Na+-translocating ferredoxin:NAD+ oxidoreductase RnfG subunit